ncbi:hypothetical protein [Acaryochloris sp. IP29b_bin.137]|uniref:hypothetical protein n=1 Tax=Acaryochloris sp. IP29b_bin.137 TaxID=2969217 RepID=UPI002611CD4F|nr:hypothetical protein [Acaryochloris sp. IP29b_bin.137]
MQKQPDPFKLSFFRQLIPHRQMTLTLSEPKQQAYQRLEAAFADEIFLGGGFWQRSQRYWGHINGNQFILHGPKAYRQFCFRTRGSLDSQGEQLVVQLLIQLSRRDIYGLLYTLIVLLVALPIVLSWWGVQLMPLYLGFIYGMVQWHLSHYSTEISKLVANIISDIPLDSASY